MKDKRRAPVRRCRVCGCTDYDCRQCIERTGRPCYWVEDGLCSACAEVTEMKKAEMEEAAELYKQYRQALGRIF